MVKTFFAATAACLALGAVAMPATAGTKIETKLTLKRAFVKTSSERGTTEFSGKVKSAKDACVDGRLVFFIRKDETGKHQVDSANATPSGKYSFIVELLIPGEYYTTVAQTSSGSKVCASAKSKKILIG